MTQPLAGLEAEVGHAVGSIIRWVRAPAGHPAGFLRSLLLSPTILVGGIVFCWRMFKASFLRFWFGEYRFDPATGQYHRLVGKDGHGELVSAAAHLELRQKAFHARKQRHADLTTCTILIGIGLYAYHSLQSGPYPPYKIVFGCSCVLLGVITCFFAISPLLGEFLYLTGFQRMRDAAPLMPPPIPPPGPEILAGATSYGDAKPAGLDSILTAYGGKKSGPAPRFPD